MPEGHHYLCFHSSQNLFFNHIHDIKEARSIVLNLSNFVHTSSIKCPLGVCRVSICSILALAIKKLSKEAISVFAITYGQGKRNTKHKFKGHYDFSSNHRTSGSSPSEPERPTLAWIKKKTEKACSKAFRILQLIGMLLEGIKKWVMEVAPTPAALTGNDSCIMGRESPWENFRQGIIVSEAED